MTKRYSDLIKINGHYERLEYLKLNDNNVSSPREDSMRFFKSEAWLETRRQIINRDLAFDLGVFGMYIDDRVIVHHINPITIEDIENNSAKLLDHENLITVSHETHNKIHYQKERDLFVERSEGDTILW